MSKYWNTLMYIKNYPVLIYSGTYLIRHTKGSWKCVGLYRMSENSCFILVNRSTWNHKLLSDVTRCQKPQVLDCTGSTVYVYMTYFKKGAQDTFGHFPYKDVIPLVLENSSKKIKLQSKHDGLFLVCNIPVLKKKKHCQNIKPFFSK